MNGPLISLFCNFPCLSQLTSLTAGQPIRSYVTQSGRSVLVRCLSGSRCTAVTRWPYSDTTPCRQHARPRCECCTAKTLAIYCYGACRWVRVYPLVDLHNVHDCLHLSVYISLLHVNVISHHKLDPPLVEPALCKAWMTEMCALYEHCN